MLKLTGGLTALEHPDDEDCVVCNCHTLAATINLLKERDVKIDLKVVQSEGWTAPFLIYLPLKSDMLGLNSREDYLHALKQFKRLRECHHKHLVHRKQDAKP